MTFNNFYIIIKKIAAIWQFPPSLTGSSSVKRSTGNDDLEQKAKGGFMGEDITQRGWYRNLQIAASLRVAIAEDDRLFLLRGMRQKSKKVVILQLMASGLSEANAHELVGLVGFRNAYDLLRSVRHIIQLLATRGLAGDDAAQLLQWLFVGVGVRGGTEYSSDACCRMIGGYLPNPESRDWEGLYALTVILVANPKITEGWTRDIRPLFNFEHYEALANATASGSDFDDNLVRWIWCANIWRNNQWARLPGICLNYLVEANLCLFQGALVEKDLDEFLPGSVEGVRNSLERILQVIGEGFGSHVPHTMYWDVIERAISLAEEDWHQVVP